MSDLDDLKKQRNRLKQDIEFMEGLGKLKESRTFKKVLDTLFIDKVRSLQHEVVRIGDYTEQELQEKQQLLTGLVVTSNFIDDMIEQIGTKEVDLKTCEFEINSYMSEVNEDE